MNITNSAICLRTGRRVDLISPLDLFRLVATGGASDSIFGHENRITLIMIVAHIITES